MNQARGRTARQGQKGTVRVICLKEQFLYPKIVYDDGMKNIINEFVIKNKIQMKYISFFQEKKPWIFSNDIDVQEFSVDDIIKMREARINVNRIVAYKFRFPLKMKVETFLKIQCQKIFSIYNCPNSKFTWRLFQKYIREMIFEAWSIKINEVDEAFFNEKKNKKYKKEIEKLNDLHLSIYSTEYQEKRQKLNYKYAKNIEEYEKVLEKSEKELLCLINKYLLNDINDIPSTFMNIFNIVVQNYENDILSTFGRVSNAYLHHNKNEYLSCQIGFKPYSLLTESGARITYKNFKKTNYIKDPEMKYMKKTPKNKICLLSITEKIDDIFNLIFQKINEVLGKKTFLKFFMRRTLCGCEFGICLNFPMYNPGVTDLQCIVDRDPLFVFTINVKSIIPVLAGVLIILLVYVASMAKDIGEWFMCFPEKLTKELAMKAVGIVISSFAENLFKFGLDKIIDLLKNTLKKQLKKLRSINTEQATNAAKLIDKLKSLFTSKVGKKINKKFSDFLGNKIQATVNWQKLLKSCLDPERIMKISFYIILCIATFIMHFSCRKNAIEKAQKDSNEFESSFKENLSSKNEKRDKKKIKRTINSISAKEQKEMEKEKLKMSKNIEKNYYEIEEEEEESDEETQNLTKEERKVIKEQKEKEMLSLVDKMSKIYTYKFYSFDPLNMIANYSNFTKKISIKKEISSGITIISGSMNIWGIKKELLRFHYERIDKNFFLNQIRFYATNKFPSILNIVGYSINKEKFDLYFDNMCISTLENLMISHNEKFTPTSKIIIAYGIALALCYLHSHHIAHLGIKPQNILLDSSLFPYLTGFNNAKLNIDSTSLHFDVFNFGLILVFLINERDLFHALMGSFLLERIEKSNSYLDRCTNDHLADLVKKCLKKYDIMQFSEIRDSLELIALNDLSIDTKQFIKYQEIFKNRTNDDEINLEYKKKIPKVENSKKGDGINHQFEN